MYSQRCSLKKREFPVPSCLYCLYCPVGSTLVTSRTCAQNKPQCQGEVMAKMICASIWLWTCGIYRSPPRGAESHIGESKTKSESVAGVDDV